MKNLYPAFIAILLAICINAQTNGVVATRAASNSAPVTPSPVSPGAGAAPADDSIGKLTKNSKVEIPPEKARPVSVPKIDPLGITIDGKPDEEGWKTASVFKDFYQTSPGDNIAAL